MSASISMIDNFNSRRDTNISIAVRGKVRKLSSITTGVTIFRIIQEALNNIRHHFKVNVATVSLQYLPSFVKLYMQDNGCDFSRPETLGHFATEDKLGIAGIRERVRILDGSSVI